MKLAKLMLAAVAMMALSACAMIPDSPAATDAKGAVKVAMTAYVDIYQPGVLIYGRLPTCPVQAPVCHDPAVLARLKAADLTVINVVVKAQSVLEGKTSDSGELTAALNAISSAEAEIAMSGALAVAQPK